MQLSVLTLLLDLERMFGFPEGLVPEDVLARQFGARAVGVARASGLVRSFATDCRSHCQPAGVAIGLTSRGRMVAEHPAGSVHPIELAAHPHEIISAVLNGAQG